MPTLDFDISYVYDSLKEGIEVPLVIGAGGIDVRTTGFVDCGAASCLFSHEVGLLLQIDVESGTPMTFGPASGGGLPAYGHMASLEFLGLSFESFVYFAKYPGLRRNLLGRQGFLRKLQFGLIEQDYTIFFSRLK